MFGEKSCLGGPFKALACNAQTHASSRLASDPGEVVLQAWQDEARQVVSVPGGIVRRGER